MWKRSVILVFVLAAVVFSGCAHENGMLDQLNNHSKPAIDFGKPIKGNSFYIVAADSGNENPSSESPATLEEDDEFLDEDFGISEEESEYQPGPGVSDPLEPVNRVVFQFNDRLYYWLLKPVAQTYKAVVPVPIITRIDNFFDNLTAPVRMINCILQSKSERAGTEAARFLVNSTIGLFGLFDMGKYYPEIKKPAKEDLGQTLAVYGLGEGFYIVLPVLGPSSVRDVFGKVADSFGDPVSYVNPYEASVGLSAIDKVNAISMRIGDYETLKDAALDPYQALRNAYIQNRNKSIGE
jgi:phospholipid-binding lipoprotein MlaA